ncbi:BglG family transcription antiterminator [Mammaliicoccus sp. Dog046]|uniref:BglG family transcription antiterminator n=1 Tax=Mammaliicoccus sp. Dog046 TaxID=3034233 RepID=UPI002B260BC0|nr:PRD domain-containing protein [Mammaliicoccus sp. Dog046]WQK85229.1 PRD domain-containing protein [Mammaliicoccus sp. Dog046]
MKGENELRLINYLLKAHTFVDSSSLANQLNVSTKTIYRLVKRINENHREAIIISEKGKGYRIDENEYVTNQDLLITHQNDLLSPIERRNSITKDLLLISPKPISIFNIVDRYFISESVLNSDEKKIEEMLKQFNLELERKNRHLMVVGLESDIRHALLELIGEERATPLVNNIGGIKDEDAAFVQEQISYIENDAGIVIPYPYNVNIFSHLYILIMRYRKRGVIHYEKDRDNEELEKLRIEYESFYELSNQVIENVERYLRIKLPINERVYLFEYLISSRFESQNVQNSMEEKKYSPEVINITNAFIEGASTELKHPFNHSDMDQQLLKHIKPMLNRIEHGVIVKNNLIEQIAIEYPEVFQVVKNIAYQISRQYNLQSINKDEIGFLTLYFAKELERNPKKIKTLITCTTGIGTSELLKTKIKRNISEIEIIDVKSSFDVTDYDLEQIDLIISTVQLPNVQTVPIVVISAMFNKNDQIKLRKMIEMLGEDYE